MKGASQSRRAAPLPSPHIVPTVSPRPERGLLREGRVLLEAVSQPGATIMVMATMPLYDYQAYSGQADLHAMLDLVSRARSPERIADPPSPSDLRELLAMDVVQSRTRLWRDWAGELVGFALVDPYSNLRFEILPGAATSELESALVAWGEECVGAASPRSSGALTLDGSCYEEDLSRLAFFERHGFRKQAVRTLQLARTLSEPIPSPALPPGFQIRSIAGSHQVGEIVALHREAFGTDHMTTEERLAMTSVPDYEAALDLTAIAPEGQIVAYCMCSIRREENRLTGRNEGYTDPIATRPEFQRRGLGKALLLVGMRALRERGVEVAILGTTSANTAMLRTATAVGFHVRSATVWFAKEIASNVSGGWLTTR